MNCVALLLLKMTIITCSILWYWVRSPQDMLNSIMFEAIVPSASREIVLPAIAKPDQLYNRNRLPLASEFSHCCACHVICMCIKRCLFVFMASKKGPCVSCKQRQMGEYPAATWWRFTNQNWKKKMNKKKKFSYLPTQKNLETLPETSIFFFFGPILIISVFTVWAI